MKLLIVLLSLLPVFHTSCGQKQAEGHKDNINYNIEDTVSSYGPYRMVRNLQQDKKGNILFAASWGGVFRYDGQSFTNIASKIGSRRFWDVLEDRHGNLWFASTDSGVYQYNGKTFTHLTTQEGLVNNAVFSIYEDKAGHIWFGTGGGVSRYDGRSFQNFNHNGGNAIMEDKTGQLWFATGDGPCVYDGKTFTTLKNQDGKAFKNVWSVMEDKKGSIWFGDTDGLWRYDGRTFTRVSERGAYAIIEDKKGNIWTTGQVDPPVGQVWALSRYDAKSLYDPKPVVQEMIAGGVMDFLGILEANDGSIWFGSGGGIYRYDGKTITDFRTKEDQQLKPYYQIK